MLKKKGHITQIYELILVVIDYEVGEVVLIIIFNCGLTVFNSEYFNMHIEFTLTSACPVMCSYCPQKEYISAYTKVKGQRYTSLDTFKKMLANVSNAINEVHFSGYTEAFLNPQWYQIVKYALQSQYEVSFYSTLYKASFEDIDNLTSFPIEKIVIHLKDDLQYREKYIYIQKLCLERGIELTFVYSNIEGASIAKELVNTVRINIHSRAGNTSINPSYLKGAVDCREQRYYCNVVLPNGDVHVCCMDFSLEYKIGNLLESSLESIQDSRELKAFIAEMRSHNDCVCNDCYFSIPIS